MEIGSEFLIKKDKLSNSEENMVQLLNKKYNPFMLTTSGRGAIDYILEHIKPKFNVALLPMYICESVIQAFENRGYKVKFYNLDKQFSPIDILNQIYNVDIFFHMGYFGFPTNMLVESILTELQSQSVVVIEDVTHSLLSKECISGNDFTICSLRKWLGMPSGGFVSSSEFFLLDNKKHTQTQFVDLREKAFLLKNEYFSFSKKDREGLDKTYLNVFNEAEKALDIDGKFYEIDNLSKIILDDTNAEIIIHKRRKNYQYLYDELNKMAEITIPLGNITSEICPFFFVIQLDGSKRDNLRKYLSNNDIYCPIHWPLPQQIEKETLNRESERFYGNLLSIPCDQRYTIQNMEKIVRTIKMFFKEL